MIFHLHCLDDLSVEDVLQGVAEGQGLGEQMGWWWWGGEGHTTILVKPHCKSSCQEAQVMLPWQQ